MNFVGKKRKKNETTGSFNNGAAKGIGKQIAITLAEKGYDIAVNYHTDPQAAKEVCREAESFGARTLAIFADMSKVTDIKAMHGQHHGMPCGSDGYVPAWQRHCPGSPVPASFPGL